MCVCVCVCVCVCINNIQLASEDGECGLFAYSVYEEYEYILDAIMIKI